MNATGLWIEIGQSWLKALHGEDVFEFPIERGENGRLTDLCRERLTLSLRGFLSKKGRPTGEKAYCAIGARGVSLRRLTLPASSGEEFQRVLRLQIESEFPLSPEELAWGWRQIGPPVPPTDGGPARQELLVVAVRKDALEEYAGIFAACGVTPVFTLAALARAALHPSPAGTCAVLDIGRTHSEWVSFDNGVPTSIRILPWGGESITRLLQEKLGISHDEAEKLKIASDRPDAPQGGPGSARQSALEAALASLAACIVPASIGGKLYLTGKSARDPGIAPLLARLLGGATPCESLELAPGDGQAVPIAGLKKSTAKNSDSPPLILEFNNGRDAGGTARPAAWKWAAAAALLGLGALFFPYAEALLLKPFLEKKLASVKADRGRLDAIDQELSFLQSLKQSQPPYLDTLYLLARSAPQGTRLDALSLSRRGEISLRAKMANGQQVTDFRSKLIESGWFANVVVEEQTPTPDRRVTVRMTAQLNPAESRKPLVVDASAKKPTKSGAEKPAPAAPDEAPTIIGTPEWTGPISHAQEVKPGPPPEGLGAPMPPSGPPRPPKGTAP